MAATSWNIRRKSPVKQTIITFYVVIIVIGIIIVIITIDVRCKCTAYLLTITICQYRGLVVVTGITNPLWKPCFLVCCSTDLEPYSYLLLSESRHHLTPSNVTTKVTKLTSLLFLAITLTITPHLSFNFYRAMLAQSAVMRLHVVCLSVRPSVRPSVCNDHVP